MDFTNPLIYGVPCFIAFILLELTYSHTHGDEDLYDWRDLLASGAMGVGSAILGPLIKVTLLIVIFTLTYEFFNPEVDGVRTNIMGYESFGFAWYVWSVSYTHLRAHETDSYLLCRLLLEKQKYATN